MRYHATSCRRAAGRVWATLSGTPPARQEPGACGPSAEEKGMFASVEAVQERFRASRYIASRRIATVVYLATPMTRPVRVEGPAGVGKTELAKVLAETAGRPLVRLQCYEGLDEAKALYEWKYAKQLLYTQMLRARIGELIADARSLRDAVERI